MGVHSKNNTFIWSLTSAFGSEHGVLHSDFSLMYITYFNPCDYNKEVIKTDLNSVPKPYTT